MEAKKKKGKRKPLRLAKNWAKEAPRAAGRMVLTLAAVIVLGMMFSALQGIKTPAIRYTLSGLIALGFACLFFSDGMNKGVEDAFASRFYVQQQEKNRKLEDKDDAACYHPLKAALACVILFCVPMIAAIVLSVIAQPYTYAMQDLPTWLTASYGSRSDVMGPLGAYGQTASIGALGWLRAAVRITIMIFVNLFSDPLRMTGTIDRLAPLFLALYPAAYMLGYLVAPNAQRKREKENRRAKKVAVRKAQKSSLAKELIGEQNAVHYGQRAESSKHKRKELV